MVYYNCQVSQVYQTMKIETLSRMIPFSEFAVVEKIAVDAVKNNFISIRIDHMKGAVFFGSQVWFHFGFEQCPPPPHPMQESLCCHCGTVLLILPRVA